MHQSIKFRKDRPNRCGDTAIFVNFEMAASAILDFPKLENLTVGPLFEANIRHHSPCQISSKSNGLLKESARDKHVFVCDLAIYFIDLKKSLPIQQ